MTIQKVGFVINANNPMPTYGAIKRTKPRNKNPKIKFKKVLFQSCLPVHLRAPKKFFMFKN